MKGLEQLESKGLIHHKDIKANNVAINNQDNLIIADFDLALKNTHCLKQNGQTDI